MIGAEERKRDVGLVADDPAVVPRRDVEDIAGTHLEHAAIVHRRGGAARDDHSHMLDLTRLLPEWRADMHRPFPSRLIGRAADGHAAYAHQLEAAERELAHFIGRVEALQNDVEVHVSSFQAAAATVSPPASLG